MFVNIFTFMRLVHWRNTFPWTNWATDPGAYFWCHDAPGRSDFQKLKHIVLRAYCNRPLRKSSGNTTISIFQCQKTSPALTELQQRCPKSLCLAERLGDECRSCSFFPSGCVVELTVLTFVEIRNVAYKQRACQAFPVPSFTRFLSPFPNIFHPGWYERFLAVGVCSRGRPDRMHACVKLLCSSIVSEWQACDAHLMVSLADVTLFASESAESAELSEVRSEAASLSKNGRWSFWVMNFLFSYSVQALMFVWIGHV